MCCSNRFHSSGFCLTSGCWTCCKDKLPFSHKMSNTDAEVIRSDSQSGFQSQRCLMGHRFFNTKLGKLFSYANRKETKTKYCEKIHCMIYYLDFPLLEPRSPNHERQSQNKSKSVWTSVMIHGWDFMWSKLLDFSPDNRGAHSASPKTNHAITPEHNWSRRSHTWILFEYSLFLTSSNWSLCDSWVIIQASSSSEDISQSTYRPPSCFPQDLAVH